MQRNSSLGALETIMTWLYDVRLWFTQAARLGQLMARGAYLLGERRRLFVKLGEMVYENQQGERDEGQGAATSGAPDGELWQKRVQPLVHQLVHQIDRLTKKLEIEEMLIRSVRFGVKPERPHHRPVADPPAGAGGEAKSSASGGGRSEARSLASETEKE